mmetsp:Transcript_76502/g.212485  ORF Transcript_76502/g.212485 Transcript_76502/m.212485 type:complete len:123 (-) Transcript_76502:10-378(-)
MALLGLVCRATACAATFAPGDPRTLFREAPLRAPGEAALLRAPDVLLSGVIWTGFAARPDEAVAAEPGVLLLAVPVAPPVAGPPAPRAGAVLARARLRTTGEEVCGCCECRTGESIEGRIID